MNELLLSTVIRDGIALVIAFVSVALFLFACFASPVLVLIMFCDARTVFRWISGRSHPFVAWLFFFGCVAWLIFWYFKLTPTIAQVLVHEGGA